MIQVKNADNISQHHATADHINLTTRRSFIGPIPEGWLKSHRKFWYKQSLSLSNYSSRAATFSASFKSPVPTQLSGGDVSHAGNFNTSFPQPEDVDEDENRNELGELRGGESTEAAHGTSNTKCPSSGPLKRNLDKELASSSKNPPRSTTAPSFYSARSRFGSGSRPSKESRVNTLEPASPSILAQQTPERQQNLLKGDSHEVPIGSAPAIPKASIAVRPDENEPGQSPNTPCSTNAQISIGGDLPTPGDASGSTAFLIPQGQSDVDNAIVSPGATGSSVLPPVPISTGLVRFNLPNDASDDGAHTKSQLAELGRRRSWRQLRRGRSHPGEIVKMEKMLIRVDSTMQKLPPDYNENDSLKTESRTVDKWREFVVVCRESTDDDSEFSLQMYKSRVIPAIEQTRLSKRAAHEIPLTRKSTRVNLYSSLDKTLVIWVPWKMGTRVYLLRTRSAANAVEWYTFLRTSLGWKRSSDLQVRVPDLSVTLQVEDPFEEVKATREVAQDTGIDEAAIVKSLEAERAVATTIIKRCMETLEESPEWSHVLEAWLKNEKMGLAWKRYDRLEWVYGANEQRMYGTIAMQNSHDLELRPKCHYPTTIKPHDKTSKEEPPPVEGFLIRLTSQKGRLKRLGKMFYKRLYFFTHNQYLCYCRPARALPPPPPKLTLGNDSKIPSAQQIVNRIPLIYAVDPYPTTEGQIDWLKHGTRSTRQKHDIEAYKEAERKVNTLLRAEGYVNLSHVVKVQNVRRGSSPADQNLDQGPDVDFHEEVSDTRRDDGKTDQFDDDRTFELVLKNGLIIRLQAYNERTKKEWMTGLEDLVQYWKARLIDDMNAFKAIRQTNLENLEIDEEMESFMGQFAEKWEVARAEASPQLFNICGISCCRAITVRSFSHNLRCSLTNCGHRCQGSFTESQRVTRPLSALVLSYAMANC